MSPKQFSSPVGTLEVIPGDICGPEYQNPHTALVQILNCVGVRPHGLSETLAAKYPYCNSYGRRTAIGNLNRAVQADRPSPGTIELCRPPFRGSRNPVVVNVFGQFYMGKERNKNFQTKKLISQMEKGQQNQHVRRYGVDEHLLSGLQSDTSKNRIQWFREGLGKLVQRLPEEDINHIVFPQYIGCGLAGGDWRYNYRPAIEEFTQQARKLGKKVTVVHKVNREKSDSEIAIIGTVRKSLTPQKSPRF